MENQVKQKHEKKKSGDEMVPRQAEIIEKKPEVTADRIQKVKKAFRSTWHEGQIAEIIRSEPNPEKSRKNA